MKILFIPNWNVKHLLEDDPAIQAPDKYVKGKPYWFFRYFPKDTEVDIIDIGKKSWFQKIEKKIKFYILQPIKPFKVRNDYDLIISHGAQSGLVYELLTTFVKHKPQHLMFDIGGFNGSRINHYETPLIRFAMRRSPAIIVHSSRQLNLYKEHYPNLVEKSTFIPFGADFEYFDHGLETHCENRMVAFGYKKRDFATLCRAFDDLNRDDYELHIVGDGTLAEEYAHNSHIVFHKFMPISDLVQFIMGSAFVVIPLPEYLYSYGQMSFLQSMALRKPMVVTDTTSSHDYIANIPGVLSPKPYDVDDMKRCLAEMMNKSKNELFYMGVMNAEYVRNDFSESLMGERIYEFIDRIMKQNREKE